MLDCQETAIRSVREYAKTRDAECKAYMEQICAPFVVDMAALENQVLRCPVTINFHPDRFSGNGKTVLENLIEEGMYHGQFRTGTTNGGKTAYTGGNRFAWEQRLFRDAYPQDVMDRPKYGALNLFRYIDGASVRFGSCFLILKHDVLHRCTFAYGDSVTNPTTLCTADTFSGILTALLEDVQKNGRLLNQVVSSVQEALAILLYPGDKLKHIGRNMDNCIETHIHGDISLETDADSFYMDESFRQTPFAAQAETLCHKYGLSLRWIPQRQVEVDAIGELFRGPMIPRLARQADRLFGSGRGIVHAALIGQASRDSILHPEAWQEIGGEAELFQYFKQLWHTVGYFG